MRYNVPVQRPMSDALKWFDETVEDTHHREGVVIEAWVDGMVVHLRLRDEYGNKWFTDSEHATIVRRTDGS